MAERWARARGAIENRKLISEVPPIGWLGKSSSGFAKRGEKIGLGSKVTDNKRKWDDVEVVLAELTEDLMRAPVPGLRMSSNGATSLIA